jgi:hypothetical protein
MAISGYSASVAGWSTGQYLLARSAHRTLLGHRDPLVHVPCFFFDVFGLSYECRGDPSQADRIVHRRDLHTGSFSVSWFSRDTLVAAFVMNRLYEVRDIAPDLSRSKYTFRRAPARCRIGARCDHVMR